MWLKVLLSIVRPLRIIQVYNVVEGATVDGTARNYTLNNIVKGATIDD